MKRRKRALLGCATVLVSYLALELSSATALWILESMRGISYENATLPRDELSEVHKSFLRLLLSGEVKYYDHSPTLGWTLKPGGRSGGYVANSQGVRDVREFAAVPPDGVVRIAAFGDSFTHGDGVPNHQTWTARLDALTPGIEVLNFGVSGYGPGQSLLRYREEGRRFDSHIVLIGFMPENVKRAVNVFRPFYGQQTKFPLSKPRFTIAAGKLELLPNPMESLPEYRSLLAANGPLLAELGAHDHYYLAKPKRSRWDVLPSLRMLKIARYAASSRASGNRITQLDGTYNPRSEAFAVTAGVLSAFCRDALADDTLPIVVILPSQHDYARRQAGIGKRYATLLQDLEARDMLVVDVMQAFDELGDRYELDDLFDGHYSPLGNRIVAEFLSRWLEGRGLTEIGEVFEQRDGLRQRRGLREDLRRGSSDDGSEA